MNEPDVRDFNLVDLLSAPQTEAARQMRICNACRYCEGLCAVFPAMEQRLTFGGADVDYLSNLCHNCGACYQACQYGPPHEFAINVPQAMADLRQESYERYVWPASFAGLLARNGLWLGIASALATALFLIGLVIWHQPGALFSAYTGPGAFYDLIPHGVLVIIFGLLLGYAVLAMGLSVRRFWLASARIPKLAAGAAGQAIHDAATLKYLDGGGPGCMTEDARPDDKRRFYHHAAAYGFLLCLASTSLATICHYLGSEAPYPVWHPVVILGVVGGVGLIVGPLGLLIGRGWRANARQAQAGSDIGLTFIVMLLATSTSGLALLALRSTPAMGTVLALHLGIVAALFASMPYGKFVHGLHRLATLLRHAHEQRTKMV
ncbi:MAG: tricarballylate utilization 4Fe-4S protein TcuB [Salinisphaera sp.]|jgi:citrate/tricarballylate utilization protein|nr:tricarballylate utilization 4Fe-4S protein TcuB [Salinisphaera sp.]